MKSNIEDLVILSGRSGYDFAQRVCKSFSEFLDVDKRQNFGVSRMRIEDFNNGELFAQILSNMRKKEVHLIQCFRDGSVDKLVKDVNESNLGLESKKDVLSRILTLNRDFMELLIIGDALKRASVEEVSIYLPYMPYQRQDKKDEGRVPITAKLAYDLISVAFGRPLKRLVTVDLHADQEQAFADYAVDHLRANSLFYKYIKEKYQDTSKIVVVSPDSGAVKSARYLAKLLQTDYAIVDKIRTDHGVARIGKEGVIGDVEGKIAIIRDDIIDTGGSIKNAVDVLKNKGASEILICGTHAELSSKKNVGKIGQEIKFAEDVLRVCGAKVVITDTIPRTKEYLNGNRDWLTCLTFAPYFARVIYANHKGNSISEVISNIESGKSNLEMGDLVL